MRFKKIIFISVLLLVILTITSVSATDNNATDDIISADNLNDEVSIETGNDSYIQSLQDGDSKNNQKTLSQINEDEYLTDSSVNDGWYIKYWTSNGDNTIKNTFGISEQPIYITLKLANSNPKYSPAEMQIHTTVKFPSGKIINWGNSVIGTSRSVTLQYDGDYNELGTYTVNVESENSTVLGTSFTFDITSQAIENPIIPEYESDEEYDDYEDYDDYDEIYKRDILINAPAKTVKYKSNSYFKITVTDYFDTDYPFKYKYLQVKIWTGNKVKKYTLKTNSKGIIQINTKNLKLGTHKVQIILKGSKYNYATTKTSKIIVKEKISTNKKATTTKKSNTASVVNGKYNNKNTITVTVKDGKKTIKVKCVYKKGYKQYLGSTYSNGKRYSVYVAYEYKNGMQGGKKGWWTSGTNAGMSDNAKTGTRYNRYHPVTSLTLR